MVFLRSNIWRLFNHYTLKMETYLATREPSAIDKKSNLFGAADENKPKIILPPLNTDIRFSQNLKLHGIEDDMPFTPVLSTKPVLNTNVQFSKVLKLHKPYLAPDYRYNPKDFDHLAEKHPRTFHIHKQIPLNFSWCIDSEEDDKLVSIKKSLISKPKAQYACGSCFAICMSQVFSDCLVVSGAVGWAPNISETWLLANLPSKVQKGCGGGNPANIAPILEDLGALDSSCVDYSWCENDKKLCAGMSSTQHFDAQSLTSKLNSQIPKKGCWFPQKRFLYKLDKGTDVFFINPEAKTDIFRKNVKTHIQDFGPTVGGYVVLSNFMSGEHTNPNLPTKGIYFEKCKYDNWTGISWGSVSSSTGLHAIAIVGWGEEDNVEYASGKKGKVPYWHCRNSWGTGWGHQKGFFKMAMYPFNKYSQFDKEVMTNIGGPVGSVLLLRATEPPVIVDGKQVEAKYLSLKRTLPDVYYKSSPQEVVAYNRKGLIDDPTKQFQNGNVDYVESQITRKSNKPMIIASLILAGGIIYFLD